MLAIVCLREIEIRDFRIEDYFEIVAMAKVEDGTFLMRHAPPVKAPSWTARWPKPSPGPPPGTPAHWPCGSSIAAAAPVRSAVAAEDLRPALGLDRRQDPCDRTRALRWRGQEGHNLPPGRGPQADLGEAARRSRHCCAGFSCRSSRC